jgi:hypothetical protein
VFMLARSFPLANCAPDVVFAVDVLGSAAIVRFAEVSEVFQGGGSTETSSLSVVAFEPGASGTACAIHAVPGATESVAFEDGSPQGARDGLGCDSSMVGRWRRGLCNW